MAPPANVESIVLDKFPCSERDRRTEEEELTGP